MWNTFKSSSYRVIGVVCFIMLITSSFAWAELEAGTVIKSDNIDQMLQQKFEGKTIASMLTEKVEWWIRNYNLTITLAHSKPYCVNLKYVEQTKKYWKDVKFNPKTLEVSGYTGGMPFPYITDDDPFKARKLIYNAYYRCGNTQTDCHYIPTFTYHLIDFKHGVEREMEWMWFRIYLKGRVVDDNPVWGDGSIYHKTLAIARKPYDLRGIGTYSIRYMDGRMDDSWVYVRACRRTRRLSGGGWFDPSGGTDTLRDDFNNFSANPVWIPKFNYLGKRYMLAVAHSRSKGMTRQGDEFPCIDANNPPYCNPLDDWEPREVYVIEEILPLEHVHSRRIIYIDASAWIFHMFESYDKNDEFERLGMLLSYPMPNGDGSWSPRPPSGFKIDFKRKHATVFFMNKDTFGSPPGMTPDDLTITTMQAVAKGQWKKKHYKQPVGGKRYYLKDLNLDWTASKLK